MATQKIDEKDKKISEVPHLEQLTGVEKIPVSATGGLPRYIETKQIVEKAEEKTLERVKEDYQPKGNYLTTESDIEATKVKENNTLVKEMYIEEASDFFDVYNKEQIDDKIEQVKHKAQKLAWNEIQDLLPVLPEFYTLLPKLYGNKIRVCSLNDYFSHIPEEDVAYVTFDLKDYSIYAVFKNREAIWESRDRSFLLKGQYMPGITSETWRVTFYKDGVKSAYKDIVVEADENGYFEYEFDEEEGLLGQIIIKDNKPNVLKNIVQMPLNNGFNNRSELNLFYAKSNPNIEFINFDAYAGKNILTFEETFKDNKKIKAIDIWDAQVLTTCADTFNGATSVKHISLNNVTLNGFRWCVFINLDNLKELDLSNTNIVTSTAAYFFVSSNNNLERLKLPRSLNGSSNTSPEWFVANNPKLKGKLDFSPYPNLFSAAALIDGFCCLNPLIEEVDLSTVNVSKTTNQVENLCDGNKSMHTFKFGNWDLSSINAAWRIVEWFKGCSSLKHLTGNVYNIKASFSFEDCPLLTDESVELILNMPANVTSKQTITFHPDVYARLTPEQIASVTSKGWTVVSA